MAGIRWLDHEKRIAAELRGKGYTIPEIAAELGNRSEAAVQGMFRATGKVNRKLSIAARNCTRRSPEEREELKKFIQTNFIRHSLADIARMWNAEARALGRKTVKVDYVSYLADGLVPKRSRHEVNMLPTSRKKQKTAQTARREAEWAKRKAELINLREKRIAEIKAKKLRVLCRTCCVCRVLTPKEKPFFPNAGNSVKHFMRTCAICYHETKHLPAAAKKAARQVAYDGYAERKIERAKAERDQKLKENPALPLKHCACCGENWEDTPERFATFLTKDGERRTFGKCRFCRRKDERITDRAARSKTATLSKQQAA